jgi:hypothetical protein
MAPMLTRLFTPMFAVMLSMFLATLLWTGRGIDVTRDVLIAFDLLLAVVIGLLLYSASARDPQSPPNTFDVVQVVLVVSALLADAVALWANAARITEFGFTPEPRGRSGRERDSPGQSGVVRRTLRPLPERARIVHLPRKMADGLPAGLRRVGGGGRNPLSAVVPIHLICHPHPH